MLGYYDYDGQPITMEQWNELYYQDRHIAETTLDDGTYISTVWIGLHLSPWLNTPMIYETMVFRNGNGEECDRYPTRQLAVEGHKFMVMQVSNPELAATEQGEGRESKSPAPRSP